MIRRVLAGTLVAGLAAACAGGGPVPDAAGEGPAPSPPGRSGPEPPPVEAGRAPGEGPYAPGIDVLHYRVELTLSRDGGVVAGRTSVRFRRDDGGVRLLPLDLTGLSVDSVRLHAGDGDGGRTVPADAYRDALTRGALPVPLPGSGPDTLRVEVHYRGTPDDGLILGTTVHGAPSAFADNWPDRARFWFPSVDHPSDKATVTFVVHAPAEWDVVANGALASPPSAAGPGIPAVAGSAGSPADRQTWVWETGVPIPTYTMVVGATVLRRTRLGVAACGRAPASPRSDGCVEVSTWLYPESVERAAHSFRRAPEMVDFFTRLVGPFPYEKMANVQSSTRFGGMENASAIFYSERALAAGRDIEGTVSHEIAHQWFGDAVTESDWHHLWLSEGFATYFGALFFEEADGPDAFRERMAEVRREYLSSDVTGRPVVDPGVDDLFELLDANSYEKGALVLHMLRGLLGDEDFFSGVRSYVRRHRHGTALTRDFRRAMEASAGRSLEWFFEQWIHRPGYPVLDVSWEHEADRGLLRVRVEQRQRDAWPTFRLPAVIRVEADDGSARDHEVELRRRVEVLELPAAEVPRRVRFDPEGRIPAEVVSGGGTG